MMASNTCPGGATVVARVVPIVNLQGLQAWLSKHTDMSGWSSFLDLS